MYHVFFAKVRCWTRADSSLNVVEFFVSLEVLSAIRWMTTCDRFTPKRSNLVSIAQNISAMHELSFGCSGPLTVKLSANPWATMPTIPNFGLFMVERSFDLQRLDLGKANLHWSIPSWIIQMCPRVFKREDPRRDQYTNRSLYWAARCSWYSFAWCCRANKYGASSRSKTRWCRQTEHCEWELTGRNLRCSNSSRHTRQKVLKLAAWGPSKFLNCSKKSCMHPGGKYRVSRPEFSGLLSTCSLRPCLNLLVFTPFATFIFTLVYGSSVGKTIPWKSVSIPASSFTSGKFSATLS